MNDRISLKVGGVVFEGWTSVRIEQGLDALAGSFSVGLTERWPGHPDQWGIEAGDSCEVFIGEDQVMTAWIDRFSASVDPDRHPVEVAGREKTADLVDCSAVHKPGSWKNRTLEQIAAELAKPFGIRVTAVTSTGRPFDKVALQQGETVFEFIDRLARQRGVMPVTTVTGDLEFRRPAQQAAGYSLELGANLKAVSFDNDITDRFSAYTLKGHADDGATRPKGEAKDPGVRRHRPLLIVNDDDSSSASLRDRAIWEASVRAGKAQTVNAIVQGWRSASGELYRPDRLVPVKAPLVGIDATLLVVGVQLELNDQGRKAGLMLAPKEAFQLEPIAEPKRKRRTATTPPGGR